MGMSASQARLLYITAQLNNLSLRGQQVSDAKVRLSMDTEDAQEEYINALNSTRLFVNSTTFSTDGSVTTSEYITLENLAALGYLVSDGSNILGYTWAEIETGETKTVETDGYHKTYSTEQTIINDTGLDEDDLQVCTYTTETDDEAQKAIYIKNEEALSVILALLEGADEDDDALSVQYILSSDISSLYENIGEDYQDYFLIESTDSDSETEESDETEDEETSSSSNTATIVSLISSDAEAVGWEHNTEEVPVTETVLVEDPTYSISSLALEQGLRSGALQLVKQVDEESTQTISLNGLFFETSSLSTCSIITDEAEDEAAQKAEAEYNKAMQEIQQKDKRYELDQEKIDTEYNALIQEEESIQGVLEKNIERSFQAFSA